MGFELFVDHVWWGRVKIFKIHQDVTSVRHGCDTSNPFDISHQTRGAPLELPDQHTSHNGEQD
jgi:hypothetical protein